MCKISSVIISGRYYARIFANGKETWESLKTDILEIAKVKLREISGSIEKAAFHEAASAQTRPSMPFRNLLRPASRVR